MPVSLSGAIAVALLAAAAGAPGGEEAPREAPRRYQIESIRLEGLEHTRPWEVRRYIELSEGEILNDERVLLSRLRLLQLGWFSHVETRVERGSERGRVILVFEFQERNTLVISDLFLGSTGPQPLYGGFGLSQQNFLGAGLGLSGAFVYGGAPSDLPGAPRRFSLRGSFFDPDLRVKGWPPLVVGVTAIWIQGQEFACGDPDCSAFTGNYAAAPRLRYSRAGAELSFGIRPGPFERLLAGYRWERVTGEDVGPVGAGPSLLRGRSMLSALTGTYERDTRNDLFFPTEGSRLLGQITFAAKVFESDYEYSRYLLQLEGDFGLWSGHALKLTGVVGAVQGEAPFFDRFYAADWAYFSIGPALGRALELNFSTDSRYDSLLAMLGTEYGIPLWGHGSFFQRGYLALGVRWLFSEPRAGAGRTRASSVPFSGEAALRLDTPVGMFNLSLGYALDVFL
jgi:outer membrane protein insertion porin family